MTDWTPIFTAVIGLVTLCVTGLVGLATIWLNAKIETAKVSAERTENKLGEVHQQLDGRLSEYKEAMAESVRAALAKVDAALAKVDDAFERGRLIGGEEMKDSQLALGQEKLQAHLVAQDKAAEKDRQVSTERHDEVVKNGTKT